VGPILGFNYSHLINRDKESLAKVVVEERIIELDVTSEKKASLASQLGFTGGAQPIFPKQLRFDPTVRKTSLR
jgi:hypothetical protein